MFLLLELICNYGTKIVITVGSCINYGNLFKIVAIKGDDFCDKKM